MTPVRRKKVAKKRATKPRKKTARVAVAKKVARRRKKIASRAARPVAKLKRKGAATKRTRTTPKHKRTATKRKGAAPKRKTAPQRRAVAKLELAPKRGKVARGTSPKRSRSAPPKLAVVPRPRPRRAALPKPAPEPRAFAEAKANASAKDLVLFELVRAHVAVAAAIQGMSAGSAELPTEHGKWSTREMILHLAYWDREMLPALEDAYQHGKSPGLTHDDIQQRNPAGIEELQQHDWDSARRLFQVHRERLMEEFQSIPEEPAEVWSKEHPVGKLARTLTHHDRHHAEKLKTARTSRGE